MKIIIFDKNKQFIEAIGYSLREEYSIQSASSRDDWIELIQGGDMVLADEDFVLERSKKVYLSIREHSQIPLMIFGSNDQIKRLLAYQGGADDYIAKPVNIIELKARIEAIFRRIELSSTSSLTRYINKGPLKMDILTRELIINSNIVELTPIEFDILLILLLNDGRLVGRDEIINLIWRDKSPGENRGLDVHIKNLRDKLKSKGLDYYIKTKRGRGYYIDPHQEA